MLSPFRAFRRHGGRRVGTSALTIGLVTALASLTLIVSGPAPAGADHNPDEATAEIHITKIVYGLAPGADGTFTTGDAETAIPGFDGIINDGQTESFEVAPGTYDITETNVTAPSPHIFCAGRTEDDPNPLWSVDGAVLTLTPEAGSVLACVFTNNIPADDADPPVDGEINYIKIVEDDPGFDQEFEFFMTTAADPDPDVLNLTHGDTTRMDTTFAQLNPSGYVVGEFEPPAPYLFVSVTCAGNLDGTSFFGAGVTFLGNPAMGVLTPGNSQFLNCIFINRFAAGLEVVKVLADNPPPPPGGFNLLINGNLEAINVQNDSTGPVAVNPGLVTFGEVGQGADLRTYDTTIECENRVGGAPRAFGPDPNFPNDPTALSIALAAGDDVICTITNTFVPPAHLEVIKVLTPGAPAGDLFNLDVDDGALADPAPEALGAGHEGTTGPVEVLRGVADFEETAAGTTDLDEYSTQVSCFDRETQAEREVILAGDGHGGSIDLESDADVVCVLTNTWRELSIVKDGPTQAPVGSTVTYDFTLANNGENELTLSSAGDDKLGSLEDVIIAACGDTLAPDGDPGDVCQFSVDHVVTDLFDPLTNTVTVAYTSLAGPVLASDTHTLDVLPASASLTVVVEGGDPDFELTGPVNATFTLDPDGDSITFEDIPAGVYTLDMTALEAGYVLDAIDCDPEEISRNLAAGTIVFEVADTPVTCTYTLSAEDDDDDYNQYPGDGDFDFETPFDNDDSDDDQAPAQVAGDNQNNNNGNGSADPGLGAVGDPGSPAPAGDSAPQAVDQLPRTGAGLAQLGLMSGVLMILFGVAALLGARRRKMTQA